MARKRLTADDRSRIIDMVRAGISTTRVATLYGVTRNHVCRMVSKTVEDARQRLLEGRAQRREDREDREPEWTPGCGRHRPARSALQVSYQQSREEVLRLYRAGVSITSIAALTRLPYREIQQHIGDPR